VTTANLQGWGWRLESSYTQLPSELFRYVNPRTPSAPSLLCFNGAVSERLGLSFHGQLSDLSPSDRTALAEVISGAPLPEGSRPFAQAYAGHQFGHFAILGDGRALILGEQIAPDGSRFDVQLKGSGRTPFSRGGDGLAALGPMLREHLMGEAMHGMGIPTTQSLGVALTGDSVFRNEPLPGAVLCRVASSHLRVGTFEYAAATGDARLLESLVRYALWRHFDAPRSSSDAPRSSSDAPRSSATPRSDDLPLCEIAQDLLFKVGQRQASLVAQWQGVGFVHGVMNTDNVSISGESIDYGPCAFLDVHDPATVFSSIDRNGRYAFGQQPRIFVWNMERLASALLPILDSDGDADRGRQKAVAILESVVGAFQSAWLAVMGRKLGLASAKPEDQPLMADLLGHMVRCRADHTNTFLALEQALPLLLGAGDSSTNLGGGHGTDPAQVVPGVDRLFLDAGFGSWLQQWSHRIQQEPGALAAVRPIMQAANPRVIPRNHIVESCLQAAVRGDMEPFEQAMAIMGQPGLFPNEQRWLQPASPESPPHRTFCGT
jgi:uncharacterized protein YdiU (UPF0061 family)